uniref:Uncharacterized protein n=1 Tax=Opuntia streptacantha TaxID=393608 RepID=A0A7C8YUD9_OPUST
MQVQPPSIIKPTSTTMPSTKPAQRRRCPLQRRRFTLLVNPHPQPRRRQSEATFPYSSGVRKPRCAPDGDLTVSSIIPSENAGVGHVQGGNGRTWHVHPGPSRRDDDGATTGEEVRRRREGGDDGVPYIGGGGCGGGSGGLHLGALQLLPLLLVGVLVAAEGL